METFYQANSATLKNKSQRCIMTSSHQSKKINNIEYLLEYGELAHCLYSQPQVISKAYNYIDFTGKLWKSAKAFNRIPAI